MNKILDVEVSSLSFKETLEIIEHWIINDSKKKYICICNTHSIVESKFNPKHKLALKEATLCTPDGVPLVWELNRLNKEKKAERVDGPNLMNEICKESKSKIFLLGSTVETLSALEEKLISEHPNINLVGKYSPPFKELDCQDNNIIINKINECKADIVFVSLGCPKQEIWMLNNYKKVNSILIGVGAAFDYRIGNLKRAPKTIQNLGMEWLFRLLQDPRRLWKRYLINNTLYLYFLTLSIIKGQGVK